MSQPLHAGLIALYDRGRWTGVLIEGPSGAGKSDLALRCIAQGFCLVADDRVAVWAAEGRLFGKAPAALSGLIEARGLGVMPTPVRVFAEIRLAVLCADDDATPERLPDPASRVLHGVAIPSLVLRPLEASAPQKLIHALTLLGGAVQGAYQPRLTPVGLGNTVGKHR